MRMKTLLKRNPPTFGHTLVYIQKKHCWYHAKKCRTVRRGKRKGWVEVTIYYPVGKKYIVPPKAVQHPYCKETLNLTELDLKVIEEKPKRKRKRKKRKTKSKLSRR